LPSQRCTDFTTASSLPTETSPLTSAAGGKEPPALSFDYCHKNLKMLFRKGRQKENLKPVKNT
jgi:hypothetical protein